MTKYEYCILYDENGEMCAAKRIEKSGELLPGDGGGAVDVTREEALRAIFKAYNVANFFFKGRIHKFTGEVEQYAGPCRMFDADMEDDEIGPPMLEAIG